MPIERPLLDILACPIDKQGLLLFEDEAILYNPRLRRVYRMTDGVLVMLADRAEPATEDEHMRLLKRARHGDAVGTAGMAVEVSDLI
ncbi:MAG TPA: Trm112 family protein [Streptosporangiaceae bacterium]|nr:Trm112 family protein [Streptosporangiaceae bacterium]